MQYNIQITNQEGTKVNVKPFETGATSLNEAEFDLREVMNSKPTQAHLALLNIIKALREIS